jgi:hypothetical protein
MPLLTPLFSYCSSGNGENKGSTRQKARLSVTLTGGEMAGAYSAACKEACNTWGIAGEHVYGNRYSENGVLKNLPAFSY